MKVKMKKMMLIIALAGMLCVGVITSASAKIWGWKITQTTDWADGECAYRQICRVHYILWIAGKEECSTITIACLEH